MSRNNKQLTVDDIYRMTNNGLDIFEKELGPINHNKNILSPFKKETNPSCRIKPSSTSGLWILTCYNDDNWHGSAISFIQRYYNLSFKDAIDYIINGQNLKDKIKPILEDYKPNIIKKSNILYEFNEMPFTKKHHKYWNEGGLSEDFIKKEGDIYAVKIWAINKKIQKIEDDNIMFAYIYKNINGKETGHLKFLTIGKNVDKAKKWRTNLANNKLFYLYQIKEDCQQIFISKSNKDAMILKKLGYCSIVTQSENHNVLLQNIPKLQKKFPNSQLILAWGSDEQGKEATKKVIEVYPEIKQYSTPEKFLKNGVNDPFSYSCLFGLDNLKKNIEINLKNS